MTISFVFGIISTLVSGVLLYAMKKMLDRFETLHLNQKEEDERKEKSIKEGILSLLRVQLIEYHERFTKTGSIPSYAYENWEKMYKAYQGLGGNGMLIQMDEDIRELDFRK